MAGRKTRKGTLGRVLVLGLGRSGRDTVDYCLPLLGRRVDYLAVAGGAESDEARAFARRAGALGARVLFGDDAPGILAGDARGRFDLCVKSPGIPPSSPLFKAAEACCDEVISEVEFAWRESAADSRWVAVTGTNGKSTVCACTAHVLASAGLAASAVGNIGDTCIAAVAENATDVYVAEVSSYQLAHTSRFAPDVAILLGITPDHLHWHGTLEAYRDAKLKVLDNLCAVGGAAVLDATNDVVRAQARALCADARGVEVVAVGGAGGLGDDARAALGCEGAAFLAPSGALVVAHGGEEQELLGADELLIKGRHNSLNALASASAALALGVGAPDVAAGLRTFAPLEHRIEPCGCVGGVECYNDSKATNVDATLRAVESFPGRGLVVLLGGDDKGTDLAPLVDAVHARARAAVCFGAAGPRFEQAFSQAAAQAPEGFSLLSAGCLEEALDTGLSVARPSDVVLLSPACASFDEFEDFEQRGRVFKALVARRATGRA